MDLSESRLTAKVNGRQFRLDRRRVLRAVSGRLPEPIQDHYVVVGGRRYPPKQVLALVTGLDRADFTTHQARRVLVRLGFPAARRSEVRAEVRPRQIPDASPYAEALRPFIGQWVAMAGDEVLVAADSPSDVVAWLTRHGRRAESMFRVPESEAAAGGLAPL
jgi:hypothetical protein